MALTPGGLPYPLGTDKVVDGDDAIKALATTLDDFHTPRSAVGSYGALSGAETTFITLNLPAARWSLLFTASCDWSVTGSARYYFTIRNTANAVVATQQLYVAAANGTVPVNIQVVSLAQAAAGNIYVTAYQQGVTGGSATIQTGILTARRIA